MTRSLPSALLVAYLLAGSTASAADVNDGLIAWYPFDKGIVDRTGNIEPVEGELVPPAVKGKFSFFRQQPHFLHPHSRDRQNDLHRVRAGRGNAAVYVTRTGGHE